MATVTDVTCVENEQTETERETTTATADVTLKITETDTTAAYNITVVTEEVEEDIEVLYDSLEAPHAEAAKTSTAFLLNSATSTNHNYCSTDVVDNCEQLSIFDDIPEPIKVLDDIISEFEASSEVKPATVGGGSGSGSGENQSEDDGYMSLSRKK